MNPLIKKFQYGNHTVTLETGRIARQATGAVLCSIDNTSVLCTVVGAREAKAGMDFFPLGVHYIEKAYAAGKIPGGFFKREGRPNEKETLTSRLIDRPIRPLFPNGFKNEVQVVCTVMSAEKNIDPDIAAMIGTSAALSISGIPFNGPIGGARVGYTEEQGYLLNPTYSELAESSLDMIVAGTKDAVLMVESEASELSEDTMLGGVLFAHQEMQTVISVIEELVAEAGKPRWDWQVEEENTDLKAALTATVGAELDAAYQVVDKQARVVSVNALRDRATAELASDDGHSADDLKDAFKKLEKNIVRGRIIRGEPRIDGRDTKTVRGINVEVGILDRVHGSALFTRGETQAIVAATLGSTRDSQMIDALEGRRDDPFMLHYNFPPYSVGECGRIGFTSRREVGHGRLARRGINAVLPNPEEFPYAIRVVSEITESNGSSSMASVCGSSLALMDAGVPLKAPVAGIAMGLVKEDAGFAVLTDILGDEDHLGDMDFKVTGTSEGITACQMDIKIKGLSYEILVKALKQARNGRLHILDKISETIEKPNIDVKSHSPKMVTRRIPNEFIGPFIGPGGKVIQELQKVTGCTIVINEDPVTEEGVIEILGTGQEGIETVLTKIDSLLFKPVKGDTYEVKVIKILDFGAVVEYNEAPGNEVLLHVSEIAWERTEDVSDVLKIGDVLEVKYFGVDPRTRKEKVSRKALLDRPQRKD